MAFKRHILLVGVFLVLGALIAIGVAWGSAGWHYVGRAARAADTTVLEQDGASWLRASYRSKLALRVHSVWGSGEWPSNGNGPPLTQELERVWLPIIEPGPTDDVETGGVHAFDARGWPMLCMWSAIEFEALPRQSGPGQVVMTPGKVTRVIRGIELSPYSQFAREAPQHRHRVLPIGIIWWGFAVNAVLYATVGLCLVTATRGARRCPACAYDLRETSRDQCPECGLAKPTRTGSPAARRLRLAVMTAWAAVGVAVMIAAVASLGPRLAEVNWHNYKLSSWLRTQAKSPDPVRSAAALDVLLARINDDKLADEMIESLVRRALAVQADTTQPWLPQWGDVVVAARSNGLVDDEDWQTFGRQAVVPELLARPTVVQGDPVAARLRLHKRAPSAQVLVAEIMPIEIGLGDSRVSMMGPMTMQLWQRAPTTGRPDQPAFSDFHFPWTGPFRSYGGRYLANRGPDLETGTCVLETNWSITVAEGAMSGVRLEYAPDDVLFDGDFQLQATVEVLPEGTETVELVPDESLRAAIKATLQLRTCTASPLPQIPPMTSRISGWLGVAAPPVDFAFDVYVRAGGREWPAGQIDSEDATVAVRFFHARYVKLDGDRIDLILRPSQSAARRSLGITRIWDGEVVFEDIQLTTGR